MKKILSLVLALVMTISCASFAFAAPAIDEDEADVSIYADAIDFLNAIGLYKRDMTETDATNDVLRWHMALFVARMTTGILEDKDWKGSPEDYTDFSDITGVVYDDYRGAISYANQMGIIKGFEDGTFRPYDGIEYQQAVTMLCRALGYTKVEGDYPWGFLQKAANIGLNAVIKTDKTVAPTTKLNRAQTAQLIFNALFIETAKGDKLIDRVFDGEYVFADVLVSASSKVAGYVAGVEKTAKDSGKVVLTTVNADGSFGESYTVKADLAVGDFYSVILDVKGDVAILLQKALETKTITDNGITDKGNIAAAITDKMALKAFSTEAKYVVLENSADQYGIDWTNGNIVKKTADGVWAVEWYYNKQYDTYFKVVEKDQTVDGAIINGEAVGIKYMTAADAAELKAIFAGIKVENEKNNGKGLVKFDKKNITSTFGKLEITNVAGKDVAIYKSYQFGKVSAISADKVTVVDHNFTDLKNIEKYDHKVVDNKGAFFTGLNAKKDNYVIYNYNTATTEFEVVEIVDEYAYGNLTGFDFVNGQITLTNPETGAVKKYNVGYEGLAGTMFSNLSKDTAEAYNQYFLDSFNQYVKVILLDGVVISIEVQDDENYIIVDKFAGLSNDGYITIWGYNTANCQYELIKINSYDGWKQGSYFYYLDQATARETFATGAVYEITSVQPDATYNVSLVATANTLASTLELEDLIVDASDDTNKIFASEGFIKVTDGDTDNDNGYDVKSNDYFESKPIVFIGGQAGGNFVLTIFDRTIVNEDWALNAKYIKEIDDVYVVVSTTSIEGFNKDQTGVSYGIYTGIIDILDMDDSFEVEDWYLVGAAKYNVQLFDLFAGKIVTAEANYNLGKLTKGAVYTTLDGVIRTDATLTGSDNVINAMKALYKDTSANKTDASAIKFFYNNVEVDGEFATVAKLKTLISKEYVSFSKGYKGEYDGFVKNVTLVRLTETDGKLAAKTIAADKDGKYAAADIAAPAGKDNQFAFIVYDVASANAIVYLVDAWATKDTVETDNSASKVPSGFTFVVDDVFNTAASNDLINLKATIGLLSDKDKNGTPIVWYLDKVTFFFADGTTDEGGENGEWLATAATDAIAFERLINTTGACFDMVDNLGKLNAVLTIAGERKADYVFDYECYKVNGVETSYIKSITFDFEDIKFVDAGAVTVATTAFNVLFGELDANFALTGSGFNAEFTYGAGDKITGLGLAAYKAFK